jgi:hypothetical protein
LIVGEREKQANQGINHTKSKQVTQTKNLLSHFFPQKQQPWEVCRLSPDAALNIALRPTHDPELNKIFLRKTLHQDHKTNATIPQVVAHLPHPITDKFLLSPSWL